MSLPFFYSRIILVKYAFIKLKARKFPDFLAYLQVPKTLIIAWKIIIFNSKFTSSIIVCIKLNY